MSTPAPSAHRAPADLTARDVCPHCKTETDLFLVSCDGHIIEAHRCRRHGDVISMRSAIHYPPPAPCQKITPPLDDERGADHATPGNVWDGEGL